MRIPHAVVYRGVPLSRGTGNTDARLAERLDIVPLIAEFRGVVQYQERPVGHRCTISSRLEMSCQDIGLVNPVIVKEGLKRTLYSVVRELQAMPNIVAAFFRNPDCAYANL